MYSPTMLQSERKFYNNDLKRCVELAKQAGYRVFTFTSFDRNIEQVFITDGKAIGTVSSIYEWGGVEYGTIHKPGSGAGTGFGDVLREIGPSLVAICKAMYMVAPDWYRGPAVNKYKDVSEYFSKETILKYYFL